MAETDDERLQRAIRGDQDALGALLRGVGPRVRAGLVGRIAARWRTILDEDDVMQVTYLEAFLRIRQFRPTDLKAFVGWLSRIAENNLRDAIRGLGAAKRPSPRKRITKTRDETTNCMDLYAQLSTETGTPSKIVAKREAEAAITAAIAKLPPD